jgi:outer membrane lipoprotein SlyB
MMKKALTLLLALGVTPVLMAETSFAKLTQSERNYCRKKAQKYADEKTLNNAGVGIIGGAIVGGVLGGAIGGGNDIGKGAAIGAGVGGVGGAVRGSALWNKNYNKKYYNCIDKYD